MEQEFLEVDEAELELPSEPMRLNMGPSHPAMHGTIRIVLELDGEIIRSSDVQPGFLHRGFEKMCERGTWQHVFPYTDRLNYVSPMLNNIGFALAVEKLLGVEVPERCQWYRVMLGELARLGDHLTCLGAQSMELGAFTPFLYMLKAREWIYEILEHETGARVTHSFGRIGGMALPPTPGLKDRVREMTPKVEKVIHESDILLSGNRIFLDRTVGVGTLPKDVALAYGITGPLLRASGVEYDVRKASPYLVYDQVDFEVPIGVDGDVYDRFLVRMEEMRQSLKILAQCCDKMPDDGPVDIEDPQIVFPQKELVYTTIEGTIQHFKMVMEGIRVPEGEVYSYTEGGNGELGFYIVSDGTGTPYRVRVRPPCFAQLQSLSSMIDGRLLADIIPAFGSINMIGGECDR